MSEMESWECCRTCLSSQSLNPIFATFIYEKYIHALFTATGIKVDPNDDLPQQMCSTCINFVNQINKFRRTAEVSQKELCKRLGNNQPRKVKLEESKDVTSCGKLVTIDVSDKDDDDDDNVTLDTFQYTCTINRVKEEPSVKPQAEYECKVQEFVDTPIGILDGKKLKTSLKTKPVKRKPRVKKENKPDGCDEEQIKGKKEIVKQSIECEICHKILTSKHSIRNHYKIHTGFDVVCEHCGKKFITQRLLLMHCRAKHGYEKTDKCSFCDYKASNAEQVKIHERLHTGEKPFVCASCGAGFHRRSSYLQHVAIHLPEKTVQCEKCPARFKSVTLMKIHLQRHRAPQYTFRCGVCAGSFARRRNVARHLQRVHATQPDENNVQRIANK